MPSNPPPPATAGGGDFTQGDTARKEDTTMMELRLEDAKTLGSNLNDWIIEVEELSMYGCGVGEIATRVGATVAAVKYLLNYHANK